LFNFIFHENPIPNLMKKIIILIIVLLSFELCNAQRITYNDLKYVLYHNVGQTEDYLSKKGFNFSKIDTIDKEKEGISYDFDKYSKYKINFISVGKESVNSKFYTVSTLTNLQNDYLLLKSSIKKLGFILTSTNSHNKSLIIDYKKNNLIMSFWITKNSETEVTTYYISLTDENLEKVAMSN
jgi:hypothetical protein